MEMREAVWAKRWQRDTPDSVAFGAELVALRNQAIAEDVPLLEPVTVHEFPRQHRPRQRLCATRGHQACTCRGETRILPHSGQPHEREFCIGVCCT